MAEPASLPDFLTIEEAARVLRVGRTAAYEQARLWRETEGKAGLPNLTLGSHTLRVPTAALERMLGRPLSGIPAAKRPPRPVQERSEATEANVRPLRRGSNGRTPTEGATQGALPL